MTTRLVPIVALSITLAGCGAKPDQQTAAVDSSPARVPIPVIEVTALDYAFQTADTIPGGWVTIRLHNTGKELHHGQLIRLEQGKTLTDLAKVTGHVLPDWAVPVGGPSAPPPSGTIEGTVRLTPGSYALICVIPSADGLPHIAKGMVKPLTVVPPPAEAVPAVADLAVTLSDYDFAFSQPLTSGKHTIRVETAPGQQHEIVIVRLVPGKTAEDLFRWVEKMDGPPPGEVAGGTTGLAAGENNLFTVDLTPGDYAVVCFIPDLKDGKPHAAHGMLKQIKIA